MDPRRLFNEINALKRRVKNLNGETFSNNLTITGDVGIGTTSPDYELDVAGDIGINEYLYHNGDEDTHIRFQNNNVNIVAGGKSAIKLDTSTGKIQINNTNENLDVQIMADDGNVILHTDAGTNRVGIGTTSPGCSLHVVGDDVRIRADGATDSHPGFELSENGTRKWIIYNNYTNDNLAFKTNSDIRMSIQQDGDVGIGTGSPDARLHVKSVDGTSASVIKLEQLDTDEPFIRFQGTTASDQTKSLSTDTSVGSLTGHIRVSINGTDFWVPYYATN
tara:strand:+ start:596 stop:1426 length:831 start_codon:yes stop_codon:yes gene_type:complete